MFTDSGVQVGSSRFAELMQAMQRIARLHKQTIKAQIDAREKRRAAGFKRRDVWVVDAQFMRELQKLRAEEKLKGFEGAERLIKLAEECQNVRNDLGPLEQDGTEAEQRLEGEVFRLQKAAESIYDDFEMELLEADTYSSGSSSASSSPFQSDAEPEPEVVGESLNLTHAEQSYRPPHSVASTSSFTLAVPGSEISTVFDADIPQDYMLRGVNDMHIFRGSDKISDSDSGIGDIDQQFEDWKPGDLIGPFQRLPRRFPSSVERYPKLITDFETTRERINKWILNTTLLSHLEADVLRQQLASKANPTPSNWAQLVIAYWDLDGAAVPSQKNLSGKSIRNDKDAGPDIHVTENESGVMPTGRHILDPVKYSRSANFDHAAFTTFVPRRRESLKSIIPSRPAPATPRSQRYSDALDKTYLGVPKDAEPL